MAANKEDRNAKQLIKFRAGIFQYKNRTTIKCICRQALAWTGLQLLSVSVKRVTSFEQGTSE